METSGVSADVWLFTAVSAISVGLSGILPLLIVPLVTGSSFKAGEFKLQLNVFLSFAVGSILGDVFLHLLPEAWKALENGDGRGSEAIGLWVIAGLMSFLILEKAFPEPELGGDATNSISAASNSHQAGGSSSQTRHPSNGVRKRKLSDQNHDDINRKGSGTEGNHIKVTGYLNLLANFIDNFTHGIAVAGSYLVSTKVGMFTTVAILLHEIPHEIGDFAILLDAGFDRWRAAKAQVITSSGGLLGALCVLMIGSADEAGMKTWWTLPFTSGTFLYIALVKVIPELLEEKSHWESAKQILGISAGVGAMYVMSSTL